MVHFFLLRAFSYFPSFSHSVDENLFLIMDFINGGELFHHLSNEKRFSEDRTRFYAAQIVLGIEYLHQIGVIYRDLKPENLLLSAKGVFFHRVISRSHLQVISS
jgi:serine/threonine protein kinase